MLLSLFLSHCWAYICPKIIYFLGLASPIVEGKWEARDQMIRQAMAAREPSVNLTQRAYEELRADILSCRIPPGAKLKIQDLCTKFSVSLGAIREALSRLTSEGLVTAEPQRGFRAA